MYYLTFQTGPLAGQTREVSQGVLLVGGGPDCGLPLADAGLEARHARLEENAAGVFLSAAAPGCALRCNGEDISDGRERNLREGDTIEFGAAVRAEFRRKAKPAVPVLKRPRISRGLMQPLAVLACLAFLGFEFFLLHFLFDWPRRIYSEQTETEDRIAAERLRGELAEREELERLRRETSAGAALALPGSTTSTPGAPSGTPPAASGTGAAGAPASGADADTGDGVASEATAAAREVLATADFAPATPETELANLPPISAADPRIADAQRVLVQAIAAAQFADYAESERLFLELHSAVPGFLPTYEEHAKMLEMQGNYSEALLRWRQLQGLSKENSPFRATATEGIRRTMILLGDKKHPRGAGAPSPERTGIRWGDTEVARLADSPQTEIAEMRVLNTTLSFEAAPAAPAPGLPLRVVVEFFDRNADGEAVPSQALVSVSPDAPRMPSSLPSTLEINATYVVPRGLRHRAGAPPEYHGYRLRVYAGDRLLAEQAKPRRLLEYTEAP